MTSPFRSRALWISLWLFQLILPAVNAQVKLEGTLLDAGDRHPLSGANVLLLSGSRTIGAMVADDQGKFVFRTSINDSVKIRASFVGYTPLERSFLLNGRDLDAGILYMVPETGEIKEVSVTGNVPMAVQVGDTTQYNAAAFKTTPDASAEDLVVKMPGIVVDQGKIQAQGEDVKEITVDGRPFFGQDPMATLRNLPAEIIDKVQVFDKLSEQAEFTGFNDGQTTKTMNIITRVEMRNGTFGKGTAGIGTEDTYLAGGNLNFFSTDRRISLVAQTNNVNQQNFSSEDLLGVMSSGMRGGGRFAGSGMAGGRTGRSGGMAGGGGMTQGGGTNVSDFLVDQQPGITQTHSFGVNYSDRWGKKVDLTGSYFFNLTDNRSESDLYREYLGTGEDLQSYLENESSDSRNINHRFNLRLEYQIDSFNSIIFRPRISLQQNSGSSLLAGQNFLEESLLNMSMSKSSSNLTGANYSGSLLIRHRFRKQGRTLSVNFMGAYNSRLGESYLYAESEYYSPIDYTELLDQQSLLENRGNNLSANLVYTEPAGKNGLIQFNYMLGLRPGINDKQGFDRDSLDDSYSLTDSLLSGKFRSNYITREAGAGYSFRKNKWLANVRLAAESASLSKEESFPENRQTDHQFLNLVGNFMLRYQFARQQNLVLTYRGSTDPPSLDQLQEVVDNTNPLQLSTGNPLLDPSYQHQLILRYSAVKPEKSRVFFIMMAGSLVSDYVANRTYFARQDTLLFGSIPLGAGTQLTRPENMEGYRNLRSFINYGFPLKFIRSNLNLNIQYSYTRKPGYLNQVQNFTRNQTTTLGWVLGSNISDAFDLYLSSRSGFSSVRYSANPDQDNHYFIQNTSLRLKWIIAGGFFVQSTLNHSLYSGLSEELDDQSVLWNLGVGKKLFKNQRGEISLSVYDLLKENRNIDRRVSDIYTEDVTSQVLSRYIMLNFSYDLRNFTGPERRPFRNFQRTFGPPGLEP